MTIRPDNISTTGETRGGLLFDEFGYLIDPDDWCIEIAEAMAAEEGLRLTDEHWAIFRFIRDYYEHHGMQPEARFVSAFLASRKGISEADAGRRFFQLFPYGYVKQACKIAGMRQQRLRSVC